MLKDKKVIFFDLDGTLIDSIGVWNEIDRKLLEMFGERSLTEREIQQQRDSALRDFSSEENPYLEYCNRLKEKYSSPMSAQEIYSWRCKMADEYLINTVDYKKDAEKLLRVLKERGLTLAITSTTRKLNMDVYRYKNKNILAKAPFDEFFSLIYTMDDVKKIKPNPEIYFKAMEKLGVFARECLIFEDSLVGVEAADNAGIAAAAIFDKYSLHDTEKIKQMARYYFDDYAAVLDAIQ